MLLTFIYFFLAMLLLILIHELGHFLVARWCGVKVLRFSFGFGKILYAWRDKQGTEYAWSAWPLGGYVKLLDETEGEVAPHEKHLAFNRQSIWVRMAVVLAGPLFNLVFAWMALWLALVIGIKSFAPIIGTVQKGSAAAQAGLRSQDEIIQLNGHNVKSWHDFQYSLLSLLGTKTPFTLTVKSLETHKIKVAHLSLARMGDDSSKLGLLSSLGITPYIPQPSLVVGTVMPQSPAAAAGILPGDTLFALNQRAVGNWFELVDFMRQHPNARIILTIRRGDQMHQIPVHVGEMRKQNRLEGYLGIRSMPIAWPANWLRVHRQSPWVASQTALQQTAHLTSATIAMIGRLMIGQLPLKALSGPVGIAQGAGDSGRSGMSYYLIFLALVSVSLGVLNLLPIPMLDGGHLFYYIIELITRRPLSNVFKSTGMYVGLVILIALMVIALSNDITRLTHNLSSQ